MPSDARIATIHGVKYLHQTLALSTLALAAACSLGTRHEGVLVLETDFGIVDGAVGSMRGVALSIDRDLVIHDLTHEIAPFDVFEGAYRLAQSAPFFPSDSVFVCVIDPGVGTERAPIVLRTKSGHTFVGPDNGLFTLVMRDLGLESVHRIDEDRHRRVGSAKSHTFHGRDLFVVVGASLASGQLALDAVGPELRDKPIELTIPQPGIRDDAVSGQELLGIVTVLDERFGNVWTNLSTDWLDRMKIDYGSVIEVVIQVNGEQRFRGSMPYVNTFGDVPEGSPLAYVNSVGTLSFALNLGDFAREYGIGTGPAWSVGVRLAPAGKPAK